MSAATYRHIEGLGMKYALLREITHWQASCDTCIKHVATGVTSLREARARVKREIHCARAQLEENVRQMELETENRLQALVATEEGRLKELLGSLEKHRKKYVNMPT